MKEIDIKDKRQIGQVNMVELIKIYSVSLTVRDRSWCIYSDPWTGERMKRTLVKSVEYFYDENRAKDRLTQMKQEIKNDQDVHFSTQYVIKDGEILQPISETHERIDPGQVM